MPYIPFTTAEVTGHVPLPLVLSIGMAALLLQPLAQADTAASPTVEEKVQSLSEHQRQAIVRQYLMERSYLHSTQQLDEQRDYRSGIGQSGSNQGQAQGHQLDQSQGGVSVGSLVHESGQAGYPATGHGAGGWQYAPQSNSLRIGRDNYAPVSLSNIAAQNGSVHIGDTYKGNMYGSQIGNNQYGEQSGATVSDQQNQQGQQADSSAGSQDQTSNQGGNPS